MLTFRTHVNKEAASGLPYSLYLHDEVSGEERLVGRFKCETVKDQIVGAIRDPEQIRHAMWETLRRHDEGRSP